MCVWWKLYLYTGKCCNVESFGKVKRQGATQLQTEQTIEDVYTKTSSDKTLYETMRMRGTTIHQEVTTRKYTPLFLKPGNEISYLQTVLTFVEGLFPGCPPYLSPGSPYLSPGSPYLSPVSPGSPLLVPLLVPRVPLTYPPGPPRSRWPIPRPGCRSMRSATAARSTIRLWGAFPSPSPPSPTPRHETCMHYISYIRI
jgi:hypothetical protein